MTYTVIKNIGISIAEYLFCSKTYHAHILDTDIDLRIGDVFLYEKGYVRVSDRQTMFSDAIQHIILLVEEEPKGATQVEKKTCSTCGCETSNYETIHSAIVCDLCEHAMMLVDKKLILSDGKNFWVVCSGCHHPGPFRPSPKEALVAALEVLGEFIIDQAGNPVCHLCS